MNPEIAHSRDPVGSHDLDIGALFGDMAVLGRVVFADDEVRTVGCKIVLVNTTEFFRLGSNAGLEIAREREGGELVRNGRAQRKHKCGTELLLNSVISCVAVENAKRGTIYPVFWRDAGAANHNTRKRS